MILTTNTVKNIFFTFLQLFNLVFAVEYLILSTDNLKESAEKISSIYSEPSEPYYLDTEIAIIDTFNTSIKEFVNNKIENDSNLKYLLIIGDETVIIPNYYSNSVPSDDYFSSETEG